MVLGKTRDVLKKIYNKNSVILYQMGKVGSTTLEHSLDNAFHVHSFYNNPPCKHLKRDLDLSLFISNKILTYKIKRKEVTKIISLVRDPYLRNISMFFQDLHHWLAHYQRETFFDTREEGMEFLFSAFENGYDHFYFDRWFDMEIKRFTGIDIFCHPFNTEKGYQIIREGSFEILLLQSEKINKLKAVISDFTNQKFTIKHKNIGEKKWYAPIYKVFQSNYKVSEDYLDSLYQTRTATHFYSLQHSSEFKKKHTISHLSS